MSAADAMVRLFGFQVSTFVNVARLTLTEKGVPYTFVDLAAEMGSPRHLALHPFNRVPILEHRDFTLYETAPIASYVDEAFDGPPLQPAEPRARARVRQWMSALSSYYYPYIAFHLGHERLIYPALGIAPDEKVVAAALPRIAVALDVMERALQDGDGFLVGATRTLADLFLLPTMTTLALTPEGQRMLEGKPRIRAWRERMLALPGAMKVMAEVAPHVGKPLQHARGWVTDHRPKY
jgi:glutathione S-transferase